MPQAETGKKGEDAAASFLCEKGCEIIERNYHTRFGEIDIIARDGGYIVFVEVKTRLCGSMVLPREAVDAKKQRKLIFSAEIYLSCHDIGALQPRFDVIEVTIKRGKDFKVEKIGLIENAFTL